MRNKQIKIRQCTLYTIPFDSMLSSSTFLKYDNIILASNSPITPCPLITDLTLPFLKKSDANFCPIDLWRRRFFDFLDL